MAYYKLIRNYQDGTCIRGQLCRVSHYYNHRTGEYIERLHPICPTIENEKYLIPALIYKLSVTMSPRFKRLLPVLEQVPGRSGIRIHRGTKPEHSRGCILVSAEMEGELTARFLSEQTSREECRLEVCNL